MSFKHYLLSILTVCIGLYHSNAQTDSAKISNEVVVPDDENLFEDTLTILVVNDDSTSHNIVDSKDSMHRHKCTYVNEIIADSLYWKGVDDCFTLFDSMSVDPYGYDTTAFKDSLEKFLCQSKYGNDAEWYFPIIKKTYVTSPFGFRRYKWHYGADLKLEVGDTLVAAFDGVVRVAKYNPRGYGYYVIIRHHNGLESLYGHMSRLDVKVGNILKAGDMIGLGGNTGRSTGSHLHFEIRYKGKAIDPAVFYDFENECLNSCDFTITPEHFAYYRDLSKAVYHRVRSGDYLGKIAGRYHTTIGSICRLNNIRRNTVLRIGRRLRVR